MSALVISRIDSFIEISKRLENIGVSTVYFYNSEFDNFELPASAVVPFIDMLVLGKAIGAVPHINKVINDSLDRHVPIFSEDCLNEMVASI